MEDIRINNKLQRVFVLKKTDESVVYIALKSLTRVDYDRLLEIEAKGGEMLTQMRKEKLDNGRNALALYDDVIQVARLTGDKQAVRMNKPGEGGKQEPIPETKKEAEAPKETSKEQKAPAKRRGRPPRAKTTE